MILPLGVLLALAITWWLLRRLIGLALLVTIVALVGAWIAHTNLGHQSIAKLATARLEQAVRRDANHVFRRAQLATGPRRRQALAHQDELK